MEIKPIEKVPHCGDCPICEEGFTYFAFDKIEVRQLETDYKKAIEALEEISIRIIKGDYPICLDRTSDNIIIIEKAYGESWEDIRREK